MGRAFFYEKLPVSTICHFVKSSFYSQSIQKKNNKPSSLLSYLNDDFFFWIKKDKLIEKRYIVEEYTLSEIFNRPTINMAKLQYHLKGWRIHFFYAQGI